jgi:hypothetical protein
MSTEYTPEYAPEPVVALEPAYSPFWPLLILLVGLVLWTGYEAYSNYLQDSNLTATFNRMEPAINDAQKRNDRLLAFAQDLIQTADHDTYAAQVVKEFHLQIAPPPSGPGSTGH